MCIRTPVRVCSRAFTLIELLVVIAIIALLVGILLPALGTARETSRQTVCMANLGQIAVAVNTYANDYKEQIWPQFEWCRAPYQVGTQPLAYGRGLLYDYVENVSKITECPTNKRRSATGTSFTPLPRDAEQLGFQPLGVAFDYSMFGRYQGYRLGSGVISAVLKNPGAFASRAKPNTYMLNQSQLEIIQGTPIFVEESSYINNSGITDGLFGNYDQVTRRHFMTGNAAFAEGHAGVFDVPHSNVPESDPYNAATDRYNFDANDMYVLGQGGRWVRLEPNNVDNRLNSGERPYGWVNGPR